MALTRAFVERTTARLDGFAEQMSLVRGGMDSCKERQATKLRELEVTAAESSTRAAKALEATAAELSASLQALLERTTKALKVLADRSKAQLDKAAAERAALASRLSLLEELMNQQMQKSTHARERLDTLQTTQDTLQTTQDTRFDEYSGRLQQLHGSNMQHLNATKQRIEALEGLQKDHAKQLQEGRQAIEQQEKMYSKQNEAMQETSKMVQRLYNSHMSDKSETQERFDRLQKQMKDAKRQEFRQANSPKPSASESAAPLEGDPDAAARRLQLQQKALQHLEDLKTIHGIVAQKQAT